MSLLSVVMTMQITQLLHKKQKLGEGDGEIERETETDRDER